MKEKVGTVFSIAADNVPVPGCTISKEIHNNGMNSITYFSLAKNTDISAEIHPYGMLLIDVGGDLEVYGSDEIGRPDEKNEKAASEEIGGSGKGPIEGVNEGSIAGADKQADALKETQSAENPGDGKHKYGYTRPLTAGGSIFIPPDVLAGMRTENGVVYTEISIRRNDMINEVVKAGEVFKLADLVPYQDGRIVNMDVMHNETMKFVVMAFDEGTGLSEHAAPGEAIIFALDGEGVIGYDGVEHTIKAGENFHFAKGGMHSVKATKRFKMGLLLTLD